ncbi:hypothetical protein [Spiroplasma corruscae]|uniref:oxidoreductase n=1 Tax=Spiroplasma corruscae TaxID=216934 RepID=UPI001B800C9E|nr:hypothetical protein [Spiroplasma corruscae]
MKKTREKIVLRNGVKLKNRYIMAPMTNKMSFCDGEVTQNEIDYYGLRSTEVAAVITAAAYINDEAKGWEGELSISQDKMISSLSKLSSRIQKQGAKSIIQLFHAGRMTNILF